MKHSPLFAAAVVFAAVFLSGQHAFSQTSFAALDMAGNRVDTAALKGKVVVLNLWFINCPNCVQEIRQLNQLVDEYKNNKDVVFLGLATSRKADLEKFLVKNPFKYQVIPNAQNIILGKFGTIDKSGQVSLPFPMHLVLDREGNIVTRVQGTKGIDAVKVELKKQFSAKGALSE